MIAIISRPHLALFLFCLGLLSLFTPEKAMAQAECARIDKNRAPLFISFERAESKHVFLRLHNNSGCPVLIPTNQLGLSIKFVKQHNGGSIIRQVEEIQLKDGSQVRVVYHLFNLRGYKDTVIVSDGCLVTLKRLMPQQTIVFSVPLEDFRKHADVGVEFSYPWEDDRGSAIGGEFGHYVFFRNEYLPQSALR
jgi:hypothetical protein